MKNVFPQIKLNGLLGNALHRSAVNRLKTVDYDQLVEPFRLRNEADGAWRCEFWGKVVRSAILTNHFVHDEELAAIIQKTVKAIMATQSSDGCISSYPEHLQLSRWDIWGRKYVLLALLRYYDMVNPDENVKISCIRMLDHLISQIGDDKSTFTVYGEHGGLAASSILGAVVGVYRISREKRFLDFARRIVASGCSVKHNIFDAVCSGIAPCDLGNGKAYEMTSCFQGLAELHEFVPVPKYKEACEKYFSAVRTQELFITGTGGGRDRWGEYWDNGALKQTENGYAGGLGETCVTTTWMHYCERIADLNSDPTPFDEVERSLYNSILGAMSADGSKWMHVNPTPLTGSGCKLAAGDQIGNNFGTPFGGHDCCRAQGPEALALAAKLAVIVREKSIDINLFEPLDVEINENIRIGISGNYPCTPNAEIRAFSTEAVTLRLRMPHFIKSVNLNGENLDIRPGDYLTLTRQWSAKDVLHMEFDFSIREISSPGTGEYTAFMSGPLVLAADSRGDVPEALISINYRGIQLTDYITAGNKMCRENTLTVWFANNHLI